MAGENVKFVSYFEFQSDKELQAKYGGSYERFLADFVKEMKSTDLYTFAKFNSNWLPNSIRDSIWARSKKADEKKAVSEETFELARKAEQQAIAAQKAAEAQLEKLQSEYAAGNTGTLLESNIESAQAKLRDLMKNSSDATLAREIAGERMVSDSVASLRAFQSGMLADASINMLG